MLQESVLHTLKAVLPKGQVFTDKAALVAYEADAGLDKGLPEGVVFPRTPEEVAQVARWAAEHRVLLIGRGAGTGLSGGAVADRGGVIVAFSHMDHILDVDVHGRSATVEPALINLRLDERVKLHGLYFPPDPSSQRASTIGGNVAENSGGPHCFKYGVTTNYITGLEVVLADGQRIHTGGLARDYPEYDLTGLITGSEGMLALMTAITVRLVRNPPGIKTMLAVFDSIEQAGAAVSAVITAGLVPATMEMMDQKIVRIIEPFARAGLPLDAGAVLIIEVDGYPESLDAQMEEVAEILRTHGGYNMHIARDEEERGRIWLARKSAAGAVTRLTPAYYTVDITVPRSRLAEMLVEVNQICTRYDLQAGHMFHAGDGNLHPLLLIPDPENQELMKRIHAAGWEMVKCAIDMGGSLTGEHGVGIEKREYMARMHKRAELLAMWDVKQVFDPQIILNPGKVFPPPVGDERGPFAGYTEPPTDAPAVAEEKPEHIFRPETAEEAARGLHALAKAGQAVRINSRKGEGKAADDPAPMVYVDHAGTTPAVDLRTEALSGIKAYAPDDLYITVGAGTPLAKVQTFLAREGKQLAMASPWPDSTIGGLIASNTNAPLRMRYGSLRDLTLSATVALADGRVIRTGRPIVKNVAGYDLTKAFIGSYGTLGLLTDVTLKIAAQPRMRRTLLLPVEDLAQGLQWARQIGPLALVASAIVLCKGSQTQGIPEGMLLAYTAEGLPEDVQAELAQVRQVLRAAKAPEPLEVESITGTEIWAKMLEIPSHMEQAAANQSLQVRAGLPAKDLAGYMQAQADRLSDGSFIADLANGLLYAIKQSPDVTEAKAWLEALRAPALQKGGYAILIDRPATWELDPWGYRPEGLEVMKRLKAQWDPYGIMNPGAFLREIDG